MGNDSDSPRFLTGAGILQVVRSRWPEPTVWGNWRRIPAVRYYRELWLLLGGLFLTLVALLTAFAIAYFLKDPG